MQESSGSETELALTALIFLQMQFAQQRHLAIAEAIEDHLQRLEIGAAKLPPVLARAIPRLREQWQTFLLMHRDAPGELHRTSRVSAQIIPIGKRRQLS